MNDQASLRFPWNLRLVILPFLPVLDPQYRKLTLACAQNRCDEVEALLEEPLDPNNNFCNYQRQGEGEAMPLLCAAEQAHVKVVSLLLDADADPDLANNDGRTALHLATEKGAAEIVQLLLKEKADPDIATSDGRTALHMAAEKGDREVLRLLLEAGADKDVTSSSIAWRISRCERVLFRAGADATAVSKVDGRTALHFAAQKGYVEIVRLLLEAGANADVADLFMKTSLHVAAERGHVEIVELLLQAGADQDIANSSGKTTSLHWAAKKGHVEVVRLLLKAGANMDSVDLFSRTALHWAAEKGHVDVVRLLFEAGADTDMADSHGKTARHFATFEEAVAELPPSSASDLAAHLPFDSQSTATCDN